MAAWWRHIPANVNAEFMRLAGQTDGTPPSSVTSDTISPAPTGLASDIRRVVASFAGGAEQAQAGSSNDVQQYAASHSLFALSLLVVRM